MQKLLQDYAQHGIKITLTPKRVKNINFRLTPLPVNERGENPFTLQMAVSYPPNLPQTALIQSLQNRLNWAIDCQKKQLAKQDNKQTTPKQSTYFNDINDLESLTLDSDIFYQGERISVNALFQTVFSSQTNISQTDFSKTDIPRTLAEIYRFWLIEFIANRQAFWQAKVGKSAVSITPYRMKTRWGSCSTQAKTIRLSIWLAQFPPSCAEYVLVHELCHLHEANHSARFWACVEKAMPDYKIWHNRLKSGLGDDV